MESPDPRPVVIAGAGRQGRLLLDCLEGDPRWKPLAFIDDGKSGQTLRNLPILGRDSYDPRLPREAFLAIGIPQERREFRRHLEVLGLNWQTFIDRRAMVSERAEIGVGSIILSFAMVTSDVRIGAFNLVSAYGRVGAGAVLGDDVSVLTGAAAGACIIGDACILGINSSCIEGAVLEDDVVLAPHTWVRRRVPSGSIVTGSPARALKRSHASKDSDAAAVNDQ